MPWRPRLGIYESQPRASMKPWTRALPSIVLRAILAVCVPSLHVRRGVGRRHEGSLGGVQVRVEGRRLAADQERLAVKLDTLWQIFGWVAALLNVAGNLTLVTKSKGGWIIRIVVNLLWMPYGLYTRAWALCANHLLFVVINAYGWRRWRRDELLVAEAPARAVL